MTERTNFTQTRASIENDINLATDEANQQDEIVRQAEREAQEKHNKIRELSRSLSRAALQAITYHDQAAWEFIENSCTVNSDEWTLIQERLPKLIALQDNPDEIYINLTCGYGGSVCTPRLVSSEQLDVVLQGSYLNTTRDASDNRHLLTAVQPPTLVTSHRQSPSAYNGNLIGHEEVSHFLNTVQDKRESLPLVYNLAIELVSNPHAIQHWHALNPAVKDAVMDECFLFLEHLKGSYADKYSREAEEYPKVMKLLATEAGMNDTTDYYEQISTLAQWRRTELRARNNDDDAEAIDTYKILTDAYFSWRQIKENRGWEMP